MLERRRFSGARLESDQLARPDVINKDASSRYTDISSNSQLEAFIGSGVEESDFVEIKENWIQADKLAKIILGFANRNDGIIIIGLRQNKDNSFQIAGLEKFAEKSEIAKKIKKYIPRFLEFEINDFEIDISGKKEKLQLIKVNANVNYIPYISTGEGENINVNTIYIRKDTAAVVADYFDVQEMINQRIENAHSSRNEITLENHLSELKMLYLYMSDFDSLLSYENYKGHSDMLSSDIEIEGTNFIREVVESKKEVIRECIKGRK